MLQVVWLIQRKNDLQNWAQNLYSILSFREYLPTGLDVTNTWCNLKYAIVAKKVVLVPTL